MLSGMRTRSGAPNLVVRALALLLALLLAGPLTVLLFRAVTHAWDMVSADGAGVTRTSPTDASGAVTAR